MEKHHAEERLIEEILRYADPSLISFYSNMREIYSFESETIEDEVDSILMELQEKSKSDLRGLYENEIHGMNNKRHQWAKKAMRNREEYPVHDQRSYFRNIILEMARRPQECMERYGTTSPKEVADRICDAVQEWRRSDRPFVEFPTFPDIGRISPYGVFRNDMKMNILLIIMKEFNGNLNNWSVKHISDLVAMPIFSGQSGLVQVEEISRKLYAVIFQSEGYMVRYADLDPASTSLETKIPVFNKTDMEVASFLLNNTEYGIDELQSDAEQTTTLTAIASQVFRTKRPTNLQKDRIRENLNKLSNKIEIRDKASGYEYVGNVLDHYEIMPKDERGQVQVNYAFSDSVKKQALQRRLLSVPSSRFNALRTGYAKTLYFQLQLQRIRLAQEGASMTKSFPLNFFIRAMLLRYKGTSKIKTIVKEALDELKEATELFEDYSIRGREYTITFCPLSPQELADLARNGQGRLLPSYDETE